MPLILSTCMFGIQSLWFNASNPRHPKSVHLSHFPLCRDVFKVNNCISFAYTTDDTSSAFAGTFMKGVWDAYAHSAKITSNAKIGEWDGTGAIPNLDIAKVTADNFVWEHGPHTQQ